MSDVLASPPRQRIIDAAIACFERDGFHGASMQEICAEAGMSPGALYRYFPSKVAIIAAIAEAERAQHTAFFDRLAQADDPVEALAGIGIERPAHGVLLAVPNRHLLAVHVLGGLGVVTALQTLTRLAAGEHDSRPGPVSPHVYYRAADGRVEQVTFPEPDGRGVGVHVRGLLAEAFAALGLVE